MKYYLAARYSRNAEMREYRKWLEALGGVKVTSRWIDTHGGTEPVSWEHDKIAANLERAKSIAETDLEDIDEAHTIICFTETGENNSKGGRHVELGYAISQGKYIIIIGPYENIFCSWAHERYDTWNAFLTYLSGKLDPVHHRLGGSSQPS